MNVYDCVIFNGENDILEIRLNELNTYVDKFIIYEFAETFTGIKKKQQINFKLLDQFANKIDYQFVRKSLTENDPWKREGFQRNYISNSLNDAKPNDIIMISDVDEVPNLKKIDFKKINNNVYAFSQLHSMYKLNLIRRVKWIGTKICKKKFFKSPQWLRSLKVHKRYNILRVDKLFSKTYYPNFKIIENGGWHFGWLMGTDEIIKKLNSYSHTEHNTELFNNRDYIEDSISKKINFLDKNDILDINLDIGKLPAYIQKNQKKFDKWILKK